MSETKFCIHCKWCEYKQPIVPWMECGHPANRCKAVDPITGRFLRDYEMKIAFFRRDVCKESMWEPIPRIVKLPWYKKLFGGYDVRN